MSGGTSRRNRKRRLVAGNNNNPMPMTGAPPRKAATIVSSSGVPCHAVLMVLLPQHQVIAQVDSNEDSQVMQGATGTIPRLVYIPATAATECPTTSAVPVGQPSTRWPSLNHKYGVQQPPMPLVIRDTGSVSSTASEGTGTRPSFFLLQGVPLLNTVEGGEINSQVQESTPTGKAAGGKRENKRDIEDGEINGEWEGVEWNNEHNNIYIYKYQST